MNEESNNDITVGKALKVAATGVALTYGIKNRKRLFTMENLRPITDDMETEAFNKMKKAAVKENPLLDSIKLSETRRGISNPGYSASNNGNINLSSKVTRSPGVAYLRMTNDEVYKSASKMAGKPASNKDIMEWIMAHEFGHQDHFSKNISYLDADPKDIAFKSKFNRKEYKKTPYEVHADNFASKITKDV